MILKMGIIGLPNVGKSLLFNTLAKTKIKVANFAFSTLKPNVHLVPIYNIYLYKIHNILKEHVVCSSKLELLDLAGIIEDAHKGAGLGNNFFICVQNIDYLIHVVRFFNDKKILHVYGDIDPIRDIEIVNIELLLYDLQLCEKSLKKLNIYKDINYLFKKDILEKCYFHLRNNIFLRQISSQFEDKEIGFIKKQGFITIKPIIYVANTNEQQKLNLDKFINFKKIINKQNNFFLITSVSQLIERNDSYLINLEYDSNNYYINNIQDMMIYIFNCLNLKNFFTIKNGILQNWVFTQPISLLEGARQVHSDFYQYFRKANVINAIYFINLNSLQGTKNNAKNKLKGKDYIIKNNDIITFKIYK